MTVSGSSYAKALFRLTAEEKDLLSLLEEFKVVAEILCKKPVISFFSGPQVSEQKKEAILQNLFSEKIRPPLFSFLDLLVKRKKIKLIPSILREFTLMVKEKDKILPCHISTAGPLDKKQEETIRKKLERKYGKKIEMTADVNPELLGGGIVFVGNNVIDFSLKNKLSRLKKSLFSSNT